MDNGDPVVFKRRAFARDGGDGRSVVEWTLTPTCLTDPVQIVAEPVYSLPVIFVPGIMGTNLKLTAQVDKKRAGEAVWLMDDKVGAGWNWASANPAARQRLLNPATTEVFADGEVAPEVPSIGRADFVRRYRFWGEVSAMSYGDFLEWLQKTLNHYGRVDKWRAETGRTDYADFLAEGQTFQPLTGDAIGHAAHFRFPVYACGYNWLQSNSVAAERLAARIGRIIEANNSFSYQCRQVILVTHSMGGLVARACARLPGMEEKIAGIVHGVMPATGAAVAYKRVRSGTEGLAGLVLGNTAAKVTAVFANSPGALQLLPNKQYGSGWLQIGIGSRGFFSAAASLPKADPYEEIYKQRGPWWALVREEWINPGNVKGHDGWDQYLRNIKLAADFHDELGAKYHPHTVTFHGNGAAVDNGSTWGTVAWASALTRQISSPELLAWRMEADNGSGELSVTAKNATRYSFAIRSKDALGDGTVPVCSGEAPAAAGVRATYHLNLDAQGHEGAFRSEQARRLTLHSILNIAAKANLPL